MALVFLSPGARLCSDEKKNARDVKDHLRRNERVFKLIKINCWISLDNIKICTVKCYARHALLK